MAFHLKFSFGKITGTHFFDEEVGALTTPGSKIADMLGKSKHQGGVSLRWTPTQDAEN